MRTSSKILESRRFVMLLLRHLHSTAYDVVRRAIVSQRATVSLPRQAVIVRKQHLHARCEVALRGSRPLIHLINRSLRPPPKFITVLEKDGKGTMPSGLDLNAPFHLSDIHALDRYVLFAATRCQWNGLNELPFWLGFFGNGGLLGRLAHRHPSEHHPEADAGYGGPQCWLLLHSWFGHRRPYPPCVSRAQSF